MVGLKKVVCIFLYGVVMTCILYWCFHQNDLAVFKTTGSESCARFPTDEDITVDNSIWQVLEIPKGLVKILNAYLDARQNRKVIRINVNSVPLTDYNVFYCQFWFDNMSNPTVVKATEVLLMWTFGGLAGWMKIPYLIECPIDQTVPSSVSLSVKPCDRNENNLKIINPRPLNGVKKRFGVCSKQVTFEDRKSTTRFIEWVHLLRILGAEKIHFFYEFVHPDLFHVISYFVAQGFVEAWPYFGHSGVSNSVFASTQMNLIEVNMLTDCFYRVKNLYDFVAVLDFDEVIMPVFKDATEAEGEWESILNKLKSTGRHDAYVFQNVYYPEVNAAPFDDIPKYMYMLQHTQRSKNFSTIKDHVFKSFVGTERSKVVHNHSPFFCIENTWCDKFFVPTNVSQSSHYRNHVDKSHFNVTVEDKTLWKFKNQLIKAVQGTFEATGFWP